MKRSSAVAAMVALFALGAPAAAQGTLETAQPRLAYAGWPVDERLALRGSAVLDADEALLDAQLTREMARVRKSQPYQPAPAIWKIADADTTIYIFGTIHSLPPGFRWRNAGLERVIVTADTLLLESVEDGTDDVTFREGIDAKALAALPPLLDRVSHRYRAQLAELQGLLPADTVRQMDAMPTWIAAMSIGFIRDLVAGQVPGQGADDWLEKHFRATGRAVEAIEDSKSVVTNINAVPEAAQRLMLEAALAAPLRSVDELDGPAHAWARGEVAADSPLMIKPTDLDPSAALADPLLDRRNLAWVKDLISRLQARRGTILFAAGAGHFVGPGSVIDLLQKAGVRVERVQ